MWPGWGKPHRDVDVHFLGVAGSGGGPTTKPRFGPSRRFIPQAAPEKIAQHPRRKRLVAEFALRSSQPKRVRKPPSSFGSGSVMGSKRSVRPLHRLFGRLRIADRLREGHELTLWQVQGRAEIRLVGRAAKCPVASPSDAQNR